MTVFDGDDSLPTAWSRDCLSLNHRTRIALDGSMCLADDGTSTLMRFGPNDESRDVLLEMVATTKCGGPLLDATMDVALA